MTKSPSDDKASASPATPDAPAVFEPIDREELRGRLKDHEQFLKGLPAGMQLDLSNMDLRPHGAVLRNHNFMNAILRNANLSGLNLAGSCFENAVLDGAYMEGTDSVFDRANFRGATMKGIHARGARFVGADFQMTDMTAKADFRDAHFNKANFRGNILDRTTLLEGAALSEITANRTTAEYLRYVLGMEPAGMKVLSDRQDNMRYETMEAIARKEGKGWEDYERERKSLYQPNEVLQEGKGGDARLAYDDRQAWKKHVSPANKTNSKPKVKR